MTNFITYPNRQFTAEERLQFSKDFYTKMDERRSLRMFSDAPISRELVENIIKAASTAPSGAHKQPWVFCAVSNAELKRKIREAAEKEEYENYHGRMNEEWLKDLEVFETDWHKEFLETAPWLIVVFSKLFDEENGKRLQNYYIKESVGIACGMLLTAIHEAGLVSLTHTPSPMGFLADLLKRPKNERAFLLIPIGLAPENAQVPDLKRKALSEVACFYE